MLASPGVMMTFTALTSDDPRVFHQLVHPSGETSARLLVVLMMATPFGAAAQGMAGAAMVETQSPLFGRRLIWLCVAAHGVLPAG